MLITSAGGTRILISSRLCRAICLSFSSADLVFKVGLDLREVAPAADRRLAEF